MQYRIEDRSIESPRDELAKRRYKHKITVDGHLAKMKREAALLRDSRENMRKHNETTIFNLRSVGKKKHGVEMNQALYSYRDEMQAFK